MKENKKISFIDFIIFLIFNFFFPVWWVFAIWIGKERKGKDNSNAGFGKWVDVDGIEGRQFGPLLRGLVEPGRVRARAGSGLEPRLWRCQGPAPSFAESIR